jgi:hypothetical protein
VPDLATKGDLDQLRTDLRAEMTRLRADRHIESARIRLDSAG